MKKLKLFTIAFAALSIGVFANDSEDSQTIYKVNTEKSKVNWVAKKVTGQHNGNISLNPGEIIVEGNDVVHADINIDMKSIVVEDLTDPEWNKKLVDHLKSDDFFSAADYPKANFKTTAFNQKENSDGINYSVTGDLTIKGITKEISFPVKVEIMGNQLTANGSATLDRTRWDVKYGSGAFFKGLGDRMIYDDFEIEFDLVATTETIN
ncbi:MAG TPA: YceI family protein [Prolixibacteraceae bacterium]|nr:YceI family protein [Prolixibacteraceae bacterium]